MRIGDRDAAMSWLRNAVHRAVEATGGGTMTRTVRNYADNVVHHVGGSKVRIGSLKKMQLFKFEYTVTCLCKKNPRGIYRYVF